MHNLRQHFERLLSGRAHSDPLYLSNRTWKRKLGLAALLAAPVLVLGALAIVKYTEGTPSGKVNPYEHVLAEASRQAPAPQPAPDPKLAPTDLEVLNIRIAKDVSPPVVTGFLRNNTNQNVASAEVTFYVADSDGSVLGTQTTNVQNVGPHGSVNFRAPLKIAGAGYVLIRDVRAN